MKTVQYDVVVVGAGPGGYAAAFYAADMGKKVLLVEKDSSLGGVCLNRGCIPSKALLNVAHQIEESEHSEHKGLLFSKPKIDLDKMREWKNEIVAKLASGVASLAKARGVEVLFGRGHFEASQLLRVETEDGQKMIEFDKAIVAVGSRPALPGAFDLGNPRIMSSTEALELEDIPEKLLVVGGGYIGMELGTVYSALGSKVTVVEAMESILAGADSDLLRPVKKYAQSHFEAVLTGHKVLKMATAKKQIKVTIQGPEDKKGTDELFDRVLVSVGRTPNSHDLGLENTGVKLDDRGFILTKDNQMTDDASIYAIGDISGGILLAHKASKEARIAVESIMGDPSTSNEVVIPAVVFTHPEIAWCGLTETEAKEKGLKVKVAKFPWSALGKALTLEATEGMTKIIADPETDRVLGVGIVGQGAGDLIAEGVLAIEAGLIVKDLALSVHPHPTLSESIMECAEVFYNHCTHTVPRK